MDINNFVFLDFETDTKGEIFCATLKVGSTIEQIILNESLRPLAEEKKLKTLTPLEFVKDLETLLQKKTLAAYSEAEYKTIKKVLESANKKLTQIHANTQQNANTPLHRNSVHRRLSIKATSKRLPSLAWGRPSSC